MSRKTFNLKTRDLDEQTLIFIFKLNKFHRVKSILRFFGSRPVGTLQRFFVRVDREMGLGWRRHHANVTPEGVAAGADDLVAAGLVDVRDVTLKENVKTV